jgi:integrase
MRADVAMWGANPIAYDHKPLRAGPRSLPLAEWPQVDQEAWQGACRPACRLQRGRAASHLATVSQRDFENRYGAFLDFLDRHKRLDLNVAAAAAHVTPENVEDYVTELQTRVRSITVWNCVYKLRRAAELMTTTQAFSWLSEIEKDLALIAVPRSKYDRFVMTERLLEAGLALIAEAEAFAKSDHARAKGVRNGLMVALLALCPIRIKNFAALELGRSFLEINGEWWIALPAGSTKTGKVDERRVPYLLKSAVGTYINKYRQMLVRSHRQTNALWLSSKDGQPLTANNVGALISKITRETIGIAISPHLFRTAAASTAAVYGGNNPYLASALLQHTDPPTTEGHYNRANSLSAISDYAAITDTFRYK